MEPDSGGYEEVADELVYEEALIEGDAAFWVEIGLMGGATPRIALQREGVYTSFTVEEAKLLAPFLAPFLAAFGSSTAEHLRWLGADDGPREREICAE